jgi:GT2 family glycosyltransferase
VTVAIAIPSLDQGRFLSAALESAFAQTDVDLKVAIMDAGSRDGSLAVIRRYEDRLAYWRSRPDSGQAAAINEGIDRLAEADYVGWLNADDLLVAGGVSKMVAYLDEHRRHVAVFGRAHIIDESGRVIGEFPTQPFEARALARGSIICQPASLIRKSAWQAIGGLDESLHMCLDYDLWWRLSRIGPIGFVRELVACSRDHEATKSRTQKRGLYEEAFRVLQRHLGYVPWRWCVSEAAYAWRAAHGGTRATGVVSLSVCGWRALNRYVRVNGRWGLINALHGRRDIAGHE